MQTQTGEADFIKGRWLCVVKEEEKSVCMIRLLLENGLL